MQGRGWWESGDPDGLWHLFLPHFNLGLGGGYRSKVVVVGELLPWPCPYDLLPLSQVMFGRELPQPPPTGWTGLGGRADVGVKEVGQSLAT